MDLAPGDQSQMAGTGGPHGGGGDAGDIWLLRDQLCVLWSRGRTSVCPLLPPVQSCVQDCPPPGSKSSSVQGYMPIPGLCWSELWKMSPHLRAGGHTVAIICKVLTNCQALLQVRGVQPGTELVQPPSSWNLESSRSRGGRLPWPALAPSTRSPLGLERLEGGGSDV